MEHLKADAFFHLESFAHIRLFENTRFVWEALENLPEYLAGNLRGNLGPLNTFRSPLPETLAIWRNRIWNSRDFVLLDGDVTKGTFRVRIRGEETSEAVLLYAGSVLWDARISLGPGTVVEPGALIQGPTIIGAHTEIRQGAYIRGKCLIGDRCVVGHTTEVKSSILLDGAKAGHFAYIGDSILGNEVNLGAGTKLANLRIKQGTVMVHNGEQKIDSGRRKFGAVLGDRVEIGCNAVTNPGTLLGKDSLVFPTTSVPSGLYPPGSVVR